MLRSFSLKHKAKALVQSVLNMYQDIVAYFNCFTTEGDDILYTLNENALHNLAYVAKSVIYIHNNDHIHRTTLCGASAKRRTH